MVPRAVLHVKTANTVNIVRRMEAAVVFANKTLLFKVVMFLC
jgi:hypothetical protein